MNFTCVFYRWFGIYCPGCGGTRAVEALLQGNILLSIWYHPIVFYAVAGLIFRSVCLVAGKILHKEIIKRDKFYIVFLSIAMGIVLINWILRNILLLCLEIKLI